MLISDFSLQEEEGEEEGVLSPRTTSHSFTGPQHFTDGETEAERWQRLGQGQEAQTRPPACLASSSPSHFSLLRIASLQYLSQDLWKQREPLALSQNLSPFMCLPELPEVTPGV